MSVMDWHLLAFYVGLVGAAAELLGSRVEHPTLCQVLDGMELQMMGIKP